MGTGRPSKEDAVLPVGDLAWEQTSAPVLVYLSEPRNWEEITRWAKQHKFNGTRLRHSLAWLEGKGQAKSFIQKVKNERGALRKKVFWVGHNWLGFPDLVANENRGPDQQDPTSQGDDEVLLTVPVEESQDSHNEDGEDDF